MSAPSLTQRSRAITRRIAALDSTGPVPEERLDAIVLGLVDAVLDADHDALRDALAALRDLRARVLDANAEHLLGWVEAAISMTHWTLERGTPDSAVAVVAHGTQAWSFLEALDRQAAVGSAELRELLETDETQVSRTGRRLLEAGLASRTRAGRNVYWELTPRGRRALELAPPEAPKGDGDSFWMEALRRGFESAGGDEPGEPRDVDPTRERIVESTLDLHNRQGIQATTWEHIAASAGVPVKAVERLFPTVDDLVRGCGSHVFSRLRLPPPERAAELFAGAGSSDERVRRLVDALFAAYEREPGALEGGRRERGQLPVLDEGMAALDTALDALVAEAIGERDRTTPAVTSVRALTDVTVWRALRDQGASPEESARLATAAVERWLGGRAQAAA
ncbi:MAG: hypothetical protein ACJ77M_03435 [Thermoleophilaceae bacterium]